MRLFVALRLDAGFHAALGSHIERLRGLDRDRQVRWVDPDGIHLTLKFLGEVSDERVAELERELSGAIEGRRAPKLALAGAGAFPDLRRPRVLWIGLEESGSDLAPLQEAVERASGALGWERETRAFQPHLTLGRVREERGSKPRPLPSQLVQALLRIVPAGAVPRAQTRTALMRSHLGPSGARYEERRVWELKSD